MVRGKNLQENLKIHYMRKIGFSEKEIAEEIEKDRIVKTATFLAGGAVGIVLAVITVMAWVQLLTM